MHEKLDQRVYRTWRSFVDDFVLICSNAMTYNQKRSRVHRAALQLLRQGKKVLSDHELVARRALTIVHPDGPAQAALDEQQDLLTNGLALAPSSPMADDAPFAQQQTAPLAQRTASGVFHSGAGDTQGGMSLNTEELVFGYASSEDGAGYSSFSDTDLDDGEEDKGDMAALPPRTGAGVPHAEGAPFVAGTVVSHKRSPLWKGAQRDVERRCRWLELRLRGLHNAAAACRAGVSEEEEEEDPVEGDGGAAAQGGATILQVDGAATPSEGPSPPATRASLLKQQTQRRSASHRVARHMLPGLATPQDIPFVAAHLRLRHHQPKEVHPGTTEPDACVPARVYAALELVERQIAAVRKHLHATAQHHGGDDRKVCLVLEVSSCVAYTLYAHCLIDTLSCTPTRSSNSVAACVVGGADAGCPDRAAAAAVGGRAAPWVPQTALATSDDVWNTACTKWLPPSSSWHPSLLKRHTSHPSPPRAFVR